MDVIAVDSGPCKDIGDKNFPLIKKERNWSAVASVVGQVEAHGNEQVGDDQNHNFESEDNCLLQPRARSSRTM